MRSGQALPCGAAQGIAQGERALQLSYAALYFRPLPAGPGTAEVVLAWLLIAGHLYFISGAVHADAIPGDRQYWLTRPIRQ